MGQNLLHNIINTCTIQIRDLVQPLLLQANELYPYIFLACMLARASTDSQATAIGVETIRQAKAARLYRKSETAAYSSEYHAAVLLAAQQCFTWAELAGWDNSARSWVITVWRLGRS